MFIKKLLNILICYKVARKCAKKRKQNFYYSFQPNNNFDELNFSFSPMNNRIEKKSIIPKILAANNESQNNRKNKIKFENIKLVDDDDESHQRIILHT